MYQIPFSGQINTCDVTHIYWKISAMDIELEGSTSRDRIIFSPFQILPYANAPVHIFQKSVCILCSVRAIIAIYYYSCNKKINIETI